MSDKPMRFCGPMVRAILEGRKTQTRRMIKLKRQKPDFIGGVGMESDPSCWVWELPSGGHITIAVPRNSVMNRSWQGPYRVGERLWVQEAHTVVPSSACRCSEGVQQTVNPRDVDMAATSGAAR